MLFLLKKLSVHHTEYHPKPQADSGAAYLAFGAETLRLGSSDPATPALAIEHKLFDLYGVQVESAGATMIRALDAKSLNITIVGGGQAVNGYLKGLEMRIIGGLVNMAPYQLWTKPGDYPD